MMYTGEPWQPRIGDMVEVLAGPFKGKTGRVARQSPLGDTRWVVVLSGTNRVLSIYRRQLALIMRQTNLGDAAPPDEEAAGD